VRAQHVGDLAGQARLACDIADQPGGADVADQGEHLLVLAGERVDRVEGLAAAVFSP
jgi:hypothetical protein